MFRIIKEKTYSDKGKYLYLSLIQNDNIFLIEGTNRNKKLFSFKIKEDNSEISFDIIDDKMICILKEKGIDSLSFLFSEIYDLSFRPAIMAIIGYCTPLSSRQIKEMAHNLNCTTNICLNECLGEYQQAWNTFLILNKKNEIIAEFFGQQTSDKYVFHKHQNFQKAEPFIK